MKVTSKKPTMKPLAGQEIISIIEACSKFNVTSLKFGDLEIQVGTPTHQTSSAPGTKIPDPETLAEESLREGEYALREDQIEELKLTDPQAYEEFINQEGVSDVDDKPGDE